MNISSKPGLTFLLTLATTAVLFSSCDKDHDDDYNPEQPPINGTVFTSAGDSAAITGKLIAFRDVAGSTLNGAPGAEGGRREVNWDGVPANLSNVINFPSDFFGATDPALPNGRKRGLITAGQSFRVDSTDFTEIDPSYPGQFESFSRKRLFAYLGNTVTTVTFKVPGTSLDAYVTAFGVILSDVDVANQSKVDFFNGNKLVGTIFAKPAAQGFSFVAGSFPGEKITSVKITTGNGLLAPGVKDISSGGQLDLVVMDDFIYNEPKQIL